MRTSASAPLHETPVIAARTSIACMGTSAWGPLHGHLCMGTSACSPYQHCLLCRALDDVRPRKRPQFAQLRQPLASAAARQAMRQHGDLDPPASAGA
eukprot:363786-Chlamydomonas_euryale.AAC.3